MLTMHAHTAHNGESALGPLKMWSMTILHCNIHSRMPRFPLRRRPLLDDSRHSVQPTPLGWSLITFYVSLKCDQWSSCIATSIVWCTTSCSASSPTAWRILIFSPAKPYWLIIDHILRPLKIWSVIILHRNIHSLMHHVFLCVVSHCEAALDESRDTLQPTPLEHCFYDALPKHHQQQEY